MTPDWDAIEIECRNSTGSLRTLAHKHGVGYETLRSRCWRFSWRPKGQRAPVCKPWASPSSRELDPDPEMPDPAHPAAIPLHRALVAYVNARHEPGSESAYVEKAILESAALQLQLVREHRGDIRSARSLTLALMAQLEDVAGHRDAIHAAINELEDVPARRQSLHRAVSLPTHITAMRDLSTALRQLIPLERQALGIQDAQPYEPTDPHDPVDGAGRQRIELAELERAIDAQLVRMTPAPVGER